MISLKDITLKNFTIIKDLFIDFTQGMFFVITGDNGSGKSSLINALALAFFEYKSGDAFREYVSFGCDQSKIILNAELHGKPIKFDITINGATNKLPLERKVTYNGAEYVNSEVKTFLANNFDLPVIENIMFSIQKEYGNISTMSPAVLRDMLQSMFNISFQHEIGIINEKIEILQNEILNYEANIRVINNTKYDFEVVRPVALPDVIESVSKGLEKSKTQLKLYKQEIVYSNIKKRYDENLQRIIKLNEELDKLSKDDNSSKILALDEKIKTLENEKIALSISINKGYTKLNSLTNERSLVQSQVHINKSTYDNLLKEDDDHKNGLCTKCHRPYSSNEKEEFQHLIIEARGKYETQTNILKEFDDRVTNVKADINSLSKKLVDLEKEITLTRNNVSLLNKQASESNASIASINAQLFSLSEENERNRDSYNDALSMTNVSEKDISELETLISNNETFLSNEKLNADRNIDIVMRNDALKLKQSKDIDEKNSLIIKINDNNLKITSAKKAIDILSVDMVNHVIVKMCSDLEDYINEFIDSIKANLKVKLLKTKKGVELYVTPNSASTDNPNEWSTIKMCSGFEKDLISLAFKVALARAYKLKILILDEIDSAATSENSGRLFSLIAQITDFDVILIVSHKDSVKHVLLEEAQNVVSYEVTNGIYELSN